MAEPIKIVAQVEKIVAVYTGNFRILNKYASPIRKVGDIYEPKDEGEIAELEYQVSQGRVTKS